MLGARRRDHRSPAAGDRGDEGAHRGPERSVGGPIRRRDVFRRDAYTCVYCGRASPEVELSVDHVEPRVKGGDNSRGNLVTACTDCNTAKGPLAAWAWLAGRREERERFLERATYVWPRLRDAVVEAAAQAAAPRSDESHTAGE